MAYMQAIDSGDALGHTFVAFNLEWSRSLKQSLDGTSSIHVQPNHNNLTTFLATLAGHCDESRDLWAQLRD
jgi:hypothetical protein